MGLQTYYHWMLACILALLAGAVLVLQDSTPLSVLGGLTILGALVCAFVAIRARKRRVAEHRAFERTLWRTSQKRI